MIRFSKLFFGFTVFVLLLWLLPWAYNFAFYKPERTPFTLWSCVVGDFAVVDFAGDGRRADDFGFFRVIARNEVSAQQEQDCFQNQNVGFHVVMVLGLK